VTSAALPAVVIYDLSFSLPFADPYCAIFMDLRAQATVCSAFLPARRYASAGYRDRNVSVHPSRAGIVSKRRKLAS